MLRSSYESVPEQLVSVPEQFRKCSGSVTKVLRDSYESVPEQLVSVPEQLLSVPEQL